MISYILYIIGYILYIIYSRRLKSRKSEKVMQTRLGRTRKKLCKSHENFAAHEGTPSSGKRDEPQHMSNLLVNPERTHARGTCFWPLTISVPLYFLDLRHS